MKNADYWKQRFGQLEAAQHRLSVETQEEIEGICRSAQRELEGEIAAWYARLAKNNGVPDMAAARRLLAGREREEFLWDVQEYIRRGKENAVSGQWMRQLENASARRHIARLEALRVRTQNTLETLYGRYSDALSAALHRTYESGYYHTAFELQKGFGIGWDVAPLQPRAVEKVLEKPWAADGYNFSERLWRDREKLIGAVHTELSRSLLLGEGPQKAIDRIARTMETSRYNAGRLVMTESAYFAGAAQGQAYRELGVERYEIVATLDSHTSEICRELDGKTFEMREYAAGVTAPPFHVYCRSTTAPAADTDFEAAGRRAARGADGKVYSVPGDMTYEEWEKAFVGGGEKSGFKKVDNAQNSGIMDVPELFRKKTYKARIDVKPVSEQVFSGLAFSAKQKGAHIIRCEYGDEFFLHLEKQNAVAACISDTLIFRPDATISELLEEIYHYEQNQRQQNYDKDTRLMTILNEIDAKEYLLRNAKRFSIPRKEVEETRAQLEYYQGELENYPRKR